MSIQYTEPGFEPTSFGTLVASHNHKTRAPAPCLVDFNKTIFMLFTATLKRLSQLNLACQESRAVQLIFSLSILCVLFA